MARPPRLLALALFLSISTLMLLAARADEDRRRRMEEVKAKLKQHQQGPMFVYVKLRHDQGPRTLEDVQEVASRWSTDMVASSVRGNVYPLDGDTLHVALHSDRDAGKVKEFVLTRPEAYELLIGSEVIRRPGDPSLEELVGRDVWRREKMRQEMMADRERMRMDRLDSGGGVSDHHKERIKEHMRARHLERMERRRDMREEWMERHMDDDL